MKRISIRRRLAASSIVLVGCCGLVGASLAAAAAPRHAGATAHKSHKRHHPIRHSRCSPATRPDHPRILSPCAGATIDVAGNRNFTITVYDADPQNHQYPPFVYVTRGGKLSHGLLIGDGNGIDDQMHALRGHRDEFTYNTKGLAHYNYPGFWRVTSGTYRIEVEQISDAGELFSPIEILHFHA